MKQIAWMLVFVAISCNNTSKTAATNNDTTKATNDFEDMKQHDTITTQTTNNVLYQHLSGCYRMTHHRDTALLQLQATDSTVSGKAFYKNYQTDGNFGTFKGIIRNNRIQGYYNYTSEGMQSVREFDFEIRNNTLVQASMDNMGFRNDTVVYKDRAHLSFDESKTFKSVSCTDVHFPAFPK